MLLDSGLLFLLGLTLAGLLSAVLNTGIVRRLTGGGKLASVLKASLVGVPLPLCSCSVLPVADQLRRSGMKKSPLSAFLISTPESGLDSIMLTYSLTDPLLTVARPAAAFFTAFLAGMIQTEAEEKAGTTSEESEKEMCASCAPDSATQPGRPSIIIRLWRGLKYAYTDLVADLAPYLLFGLVLAGLLEAVFGDYLSNLSPFWKEGLVGYIGAIISGLPLYICATASTPLAAVLLSFGFSPGAVLVFLLVGPASNLASIVVLKKILGVGGLIRYLTAIIIGAVICGLVLDAAYGWLGMVAAYHGGGHEHTAGIFSILGAVVLAALVLYYSLQKIVKSLRRFFV